VQFHKIREQQSDKILVRGAEMPCDLCALPRTQMGIELVRSSATCGEFVFELRFSGRAIGDCRRSATSFFQTFNRQLPVAGVVLGLNFMLCAIITRSIGLAAANFTNRRHQFPRTAAPTLHFHLCNGSVRLSRSKITGFGPEGREYILEAFHHIVRNSPGSCRMRTLDAGLRFGETFH